MTLTHKLAALAAGVTLALGVGTAQAYTLEERVVGCIETQATLDLVFEAYSEGVDRALVESIFLDDPEEIPAQRYVVATIIEALYGIPDGAKLVSLEAYQVATFSSCIQIIGAGFMEAPTANTTSAVGKTRKGV